MFREEFGFTRVIELLIQYKKPFIGHNMIFDMAFMYRQFISGTGDLPKDYEEFVKQWKKYFPQTIYDTKVLA